MNPVDILLLIGELEGSSAQCRKLKFIEDSLVLDEMKKRYYKLYFKLKREQNHAKIIAIIKSFWIIFFKIVK